MIWIWIVAYLTVGAAVFGAIAGLSNTDVEGTPPWKLMRGLAMSMAAWPFVLISTIVYVLSSNSRWPR